MDEMKTCSKCHESKPLSEFNKKSGMCKPCQVEYRHEYYLAHREKALEAAKVYADTHVEQRRETSLEWGRKNKEKINEQHRERYNLEKDRTRKTIYKLKHPKRVAERQAKAGKEWRKYNKEKTAAHKGWARYCASNDVAIPCYCQQCHQECKPHAHHYLGYAKENWLDVVFLCPLCHRRIHKDLLVTDLTVSNL